MNWQMIIGVFFIIGGFGNIFKNFSAFLFGVAVGSALLYWGLVKKKIVKSPFPNKQNAHSLIVENFSVVGVCYYQENINKLACKNSDWHLTAAQINANGKAGNRIFRYNYVNKPVKLIPEPTNPDDKNAIMVLVAGEKVGYISREENKHVAEILKKHDIKYISGFVGGGEYKFISQDLEIEKFEDSNYVNIRIAYL